ncbi:MAG TPA: lactate 2-monooxygenase [Cyclobacteriaceae bacterium]|nr:lactate 2-monooxygenase [Cyclobacteriaceae bacterium]
MSLSAPDWQKEIYLNGLAGKKLNVTVSLTDLEQRARSVMTTRAFDYIAGGAGLEHTISHNRSAFDKYRIIPRMLNDVGTRDTSINLFGKTLPFPLLLSPVGVLELAHKDADLAVGKAAARTSIPFIFSNQASVPMEDVSAAMGNSTRWFQMYWSKSRDLVASFAHRAEVSGCSAIVVTLDTTLLGWRTRDLDLAYLPFLEGKGIAQYTSDPVFQKLMDEPDANPTEKRKITLHAIAGLMKMTSAYPGGNFLSKLLSGRPRKAVQKFVSIYSNPALTWSDLSFLRDHTKLPILLKGILHKDDASKAVDHGINGIIVSNHGGRQVDGSVATLDSLPQITKTINKKIPVLVDGGIRGGADMFKAIALGADAVCIGRPYAYGLAIAGEQGVYEVIRNFMADFELTMALSGCKSVKEIGEGNFVNSL